MFLDPAYTKYEDRRKDNQAYFLKEKDRKMVEEAVVKQIGVREKGNRESRDDRW